MKKKILGLGLSALLMGSVMLPNMVEAINLPYSTHATKKILCYLSPGGQQKGWIDPGDYVIVEQVQGNWAYGSYPISGGRTRRWFLLSEIYTAPTPAPAQSGRISSFISDYRWREGIAWNGSQRPKLSPYSASGCAAYAADYAKYVHYNNSPRGGSRFTSTSAVRAGDILHLTGGKYGQHWLVVLNRSGNTLDTISGNLSNKVTRRNYSINGNYIYSSQAGNQTLADGYHF